MSETVAASPWDSPTVAEIQRIVLHVLKPSGLARWWDVPIPALHNATARQYVEAGDADQLLLYVHTYLDATFT